MRCSKTRVRVVLDYVGKSCHGYRFVTGDLEDKQFSEGGMQTEAGRDIDGCCLAC